jgi:hypothetical protein
MKVRNLLLAATGITFAGTAFGYVGTQAYEASVNPKSGVAATSIHFAKLEPVVTAAEKEGAVQTAEPGQSAHQSVPTKPRDERLGPAYVFEPYPRDPAEWQGMLVNRTTSVSCAGTGFCQLALACVNERCGPCTEDSHCQSGEICAVDHCLLAEFVDCSSRLDCPDGEVCVLSDYSDDSRGNGDMRSWCSGSVPNRDEPPVEYKPEDYRRATLSPEDRLMNALRSGANSP